MDETVEVRRSLRGDSVVITGAGRGIGRDAAIALANEGALVHVSDADYDAALSVAEEIGRDGGQAWGYRCDVADQGSVHKFFSNVAAAAGRVDVLVNNAGVYPLLDFETTTVADFDRVMDINFKGVFLCTMEAVPLMRERGGSMITVGSPAGTLASIARPGPRRLPLYGASKAAVDRWVLGVAHELATLKIAANVLYPGVVVRTPGMETLGLPDVTMAPSVTADAIAPAIVWLAAERVDGVCGRVVDATEFGTVWGVRA